MNEYDACSQFNYYLYKPEQVIAWINNNNRKTETMDTYKVGSGEQQIRLAIDISTNGFAWTKGFFIENDNIIAIPKCASNSGGNIVQMDIGQAKSLLGNSLYIITKIHIFWENQVAREIEYNQISARYVLTDGDDESVEFSTFDTKVNVSDDFSVVYLYKDIQLR